MPHLRTVSWKDSAGDRPGGFPFDVPAIASLDVLECSPSVTFFVGENGSGKSTLLEALALAAGLPIVGSQDGARDRTLDRQRALGRAFRLTWAKRTRRGFFLRAEDFFGFQQRLGRERRELEERLNALEREYADRSAYARQLARGPAAASLADMTRRYGDDPDARSHGEAFLELFKGRFVPGGVYLLDEPEVPLSPQNQVGLLALLLDMVERNAQFIVATHSPILLAVPGATIYSFDETPIARVAWDDLDHVALTRAFLNDPESFIRRLRPDGA
jgi:predicted ATPase